MVRLFILFYVIFACSFASAKKKEIGKVLIAKGKVYLVEKSKNKSKKKKLTKLKKNSFVYEKDYIKTNKKSFAKIQLSDKTIINVGPSSSLSLKEYLFSSKKKNRINVVRFLKGKFRTKVQMKAREGDKIKLISSKDVALGVRGTEILTNIYKVKGKLTNDVALLSGEGELIVGGKKKMIKKGDLFNSNKGLNKIEKLTEKQIQKLKERSEFLDNQQDRQGNFKKDQPKKSDKKAKKAKKEAKDDVQEDEEEEWVDCEEGDDDPDCQYDIEDMIQVEVEEE